MKKTFITKHEKLLLGATILPVTFSTVVACTNKDEEFHFKNHKLESMAKYETIIANAEKQPYERTIDKNQVKLVSLGDSLGAGFSAIDMQDHRGFMDKAGNISGISYGSYLARAFKAQKKLGDYNNFALGGATTGSLRNMLDPTFKRFTKKDQTAIAFGETLKSNIPTEPQRFKTLETKIKDANFITISIGANDILSQIKLGGMSVTDILKNGVSSMKMSGGIQSLVSYDVDAFNFAVKRAQVNLVATIAKIKEWNPGVKIAMVGYPMPVTQLSSILKLVKDKNGKTPLVEVILRKLDEIGQGIAKKFDTVDFIDAYISNIWDPHALELAPELIDIHPGPKGYKMIASTILANLSKDKTKATTKFAKPLVSTNMKDYRLEQNYASVIDEYSDFKTPLSPEAMKVEGKAKPFKLVHMVATLTDKLISAMNPINKSTKTTSASAAYPKSKTTSSNTPDFTSILKQIETFIVSLMYSTQKGLTSGSVKVSKGSEKDIVYILVKLTHFLSDATSFTHPDLTKQPQLAWQEEVGSWMLIKSILENIAKHHPFTAKWKEVWDLITNQVDKKLYSFAKMGQSKQIAKELVKIMADGPAQDYIK